MSEFERAEKAEADAARFSAELQAAREHNAETEMLLLAANTTIREQAEQIRQKDEVIVGLSKKLEAARAALNDTSSAGLSPVDAAELLFSGADVLYGPTEQERRHMRGFVSHFRAESATCSVYLGGSS